MAKEDKKTESKNKKEKESDKGNRKARTGLPQVNMLDAIVYVKKAYDSIGTNLKSFSGMAKVMGISEAFAKRAFGEFKDYGIIEPESNGWKISDLGRRAIKGEKSAVVEILERNSILKILYSELKDKKYDRDYIEDYIKKKRFAYNIKVSSVADRFIAAMDYIRNLEEGGTSVVIEERESPIQNSLFIDIIKLKFALSPPPKKDIAKFVEELSKEAKKTEDIVIKSLVEQMLNKKDNEPILNALLDSLIGIISQKHPSFSFETGELKKEIEEKK